MMSAPKKTTVAVLALMGALMGTAALAEKGGMGMGGPGGEDRGAMLTEMFDKVDADKDGKVTYAELEANKKAEFAAADTNGDGVLSAEELSARELARFQEKLADRTQAMLDDKDNDGNGSLSEAELGDGPVMRNFARVDADNDGSITKDEIQAAMKHHKKRGHGDDAGDDKDGN
jgi:Ca2+-binding EF-hand superfamily protein